MTGRPSIEFVLVALTGGIGAGKSTIAMALRERGARVLDADEIARDVLDPLTPSGRRTLAILAARFGDAILRDDRSLDREKVANIVFHDDRRRREFNEIVHPAIRDATATVIRNERSRGGVLVHEIPLLTKDSEPLPWRYDFIVTVEAQTDERVRRLAQHRGYTYDHAIARIRAQGDEQGRIAIADLVLRTDGALADTLGAVDALWERLTRQH